MSVKKSTLADRFLWKLDDTIQKRSQWSWEFYRLWCKSTLLYFWTLSTNSCSTELLKWRHQGFFFESLNNWGRDMIHTDLKCTSLSLKVLYMWLHLQCRVLKYFQFSHFHYVVFRLYSKQVLIHTTQRSWLGRVSYTALHCH